MKIRDVKIQVIKRDAKDIPGVDLTHGGVSFMKKLTEVPIVRIITDEGVEGNSCGISGLGLAEYLASLRPLLLGEDPLYREKLWQKLWEMSRVLFLPQPALGVIDVALWDIGGKVANLPVYQMLGAYRDKIRAYASSAQYPDVQAYVEEALKLKERGLTAYKLHASGIPNQDLAVCRAVREAVGDEMILMHDPVGRYDHEQALKVGRELEKLNFYWYEEPISDFDIHGLIQLCSALDIPIAGKEALPGNLYSTPEYITRGALDIIRADVLYSGGITAVKKTAALAEAFGVKCEIHTNDNPLMNAANIHVSCSIRNCDFYEWFLPEELQWDLGVKDSLRIDNEGYVHVPKGAGLGIEIDWDYINSHTTATV